MRNPGLKVDKVPSWPLLLIAVSVKILDSFLRIGITPQRGRVFTGEFLYSRPSKSAIFQL